MEAKVTQNVLSDLAIELTGFYPKHCYPEPLRLVRYWDEEQKREFVFLTNATHISALLVAELYKNRWQVELFFKWLKQHLKIKKFWGTPENAVMIQIYTAYVPTVWCQLFSMTCNLKEVHTKFFKY